MKKIININGGLGRVIAFTGAIEYIKKKNPDWEIDIITSNPEVFKFNPNVDKVLPVNTPYLWDYIKDSEYFEPEPYNLYEFYHNQKHFINCFIEELTGDDVFEMPKLYLSEFEKFEGEGFVKKLDKPLILFQPHGAAGGKGIDQTHRSIQDDYALKIYNKLKEDYSVFIIKNSDQIGIPGARTFNGLPIRQIFALIPYATAIISCDSFLFHAAAALGKKAYVFWRGTIPANFQYEMHKNFVTTTGTIHHIPNRLPHNIQFYESKNMNNTFPDEHIDEMIKDIKGGKTI